MTTKLHPETLYVMNEIQKLEESIDYNFGFSKHDMDEFNQKFKKLKEDQKKKIKNNLIENNICVIELSYDLNNDKVIDSVKNIVDVVKGVIGWKIPNNEVKEEIVARGFISSFNLNERNETTLRNTVQKAFPNREGLWDLGIRGHGKKGFQTFPPINRQFRIH